MKIRGGNLPHAEATHLEHKSGDQTGVELNLASGSYYERYSSSSRREHTSGSWSTSMVSTESVVPLVGKLLDASRSTSGSRLESIPTACARKYDLSSRTFIW